MAQRFVEVYRSEITSTNAMPSPRATASNHENQRSETPCAEVSAAMMNAVTTPERLSNAQRESNVQSTWRPRPSTPLPGQ